MSIIYLFSSMNAMQFTTAPFRKPLFSFRSEQKLKTNEFDIKDSFITFLGLAIKHRQNQQALCKKNSAAYHDEGLRVKRLKIQMELFIMMNYGKNIKNQDKHVIQLRKKLRNTFEVNSPGYLKQQAKLLAHKAANNIEQPTKNFFHRSLSREI